MAATTNKRVLYVSGLSEEVDLKILQEAFIPFGHVVDVQIPMDFVNQKHRGFGFVEFESEVDALDAIDNLHNSELFGRTIRVTNSKVSKTKTSNYKPVWTTDEWLQKHSNETIEKKVAEIIVDQSPDSPNPRIFMDISIGGQFAGRMQFELRTDIVPITADNFRRLCIASRGSGYRGSILHRIIPGFVAQGGDFTNQNGTGGLSIYGKEFEDENFELKHDKIGVLSMANSGPNTNMSQFFILFKPAPNLDGKHVVFGRMTDGIETLMKIESVGTKKGRPIRRVLIEDCGELELNA
ncbi:hypothetical protein HZS_4385 [Henneguya salminicola]|nr:hypothetical protein HZS_4385 [Henneguya salminicola]